MKFSIRDLMWLTAVVALAIAHFTNVRISLQDQRRRNELAGDIQALEIEVFGPDRIYPAYERRTMEERVTAIAAKWRIDGIIKSFQHQDVEITVLHGKAENLQRQINRTGGTAQLEAAILDINAQLAALQGDVANIQSHPEPNTHDVCP